MEFSYSYKGSSEVSSSASSTDMSFAPDTNRPPTFFKGELLKGTIFREAISALHDVVVSDLRFKPQDKTAYLAWRAKQDQYDVAAIVAGAGRVADEIKALTAELSELEKRYTSRMAPWYEARTKYYKWLYEVNRDFWFVLDPVITVHPDEIFFECFSQDESSYGRLGCEYDVFKNIGEFACGTTNIDYSDALYAEFQKIRSYKTTKLEVDASGFELKTTHEEDYKELKIDLPDSWVRGFLQVSSAMSLPATTFELHPMDVHNLCFVLRRHKEKKGPRALRWRLQPGKPVVAVFEPWDTEVVCPRSIYQGREATEIRTWGRRRILIMERLIPIAWKFKVHLLGRGLPSFWVCDMGGLTFTLGLSGWTANDWSTAGNFDLMAPRADVDSMTKQRVFDGLKKHWFRKPDDLARELGLDRGTVLGALGAWTQAGRAIYDLSKDVYRVRELAKDPLPMDKLRFANPREQSANELVVTKNAVRVDGVQEMGDRLSLRGSVKARYQSFVVSLILDKDERMIEANCGCNWHSQNKLMKGPCEHILALRIAFARGNPTASGAPKGPPSMPW